MHLDECRICSTSTSVVTDHEVEPAEKMIVQLWQNLFSEAHSDVTFVCKGDARVRCNRAALSAASQFFDSLLNRDWRESAQVEVRLPTVGAHLLESYVFEHFRTGSTPTSARTDDAATVFEAYELARQYCLSSLELHLLEELVRKMDLASAGWLLRRALDVQAADLALVALEFLAKAYSQGFTGASIAGLSPKALEQYLQSPLPDEQSVSQVHLLETIVEWGREQLDLPAGLYNGKVAKEEREELRQLVKPLVALVDLESIPAAVLEANYEPLELFSQEKLLKVYRAQAKAAMPAQSSIKERSFWDAKNMPESVVLRDSSTAEFRIFDGHVGLRSKMGLTTGKWQWKLRFLKVGRKYAWAGIVDSSAKMSMFPGSQFGGFMFGSGGLIRSKAPDVHDEVKKRVCEDWHRDGCVVTVHLDMDRRECGFSVDHEFIGILFYNLPACVFPAVSQSGCGMVRFLSIDAVSDMPSHDAQLWG